MTIQTQSQYRLLWTPVVIWKLIAVSSYPQIWIGILQQICNWGLRVASIHLHISMERYFYLLGSYSLQRRHTLIFGDNWLRLNQSALYLASGITSQDLLYASFRGTASHPAFYVGHDHDKRKVVVAIRGTLSVEDCLTDAMAHHMSMDAIANQLGCDGVGEFAHEGFLRAAHTRGGECGGKRILTKENPWRYQWCFIRIVGCRYQSIIGSSLRCALPCVSCRALNWPSQEV
nr:hypothetical protein BRAFLDRAFT_93164 [Albugo laibachii Nc14]|eukprot:CCA27836.1 hypothetical protein BRAFLDRAFT_93164 [Albugo laibachii Nc14]